MQFVYLLYGRPKKQDPDTYREILLGVYSSREKALQARAKEEQLHEAQDQERWTRGYDPDYMPSTEVVYCISSEEVDPTR